MSQSNYNIPNDSAPAVRAQLNSVFGSIATNNSGPTAPTTTFAYQWWYDTTANILKMRNAANSAWIDIALFDQTGGTFRILTTFASQAEAEAGTDNAKVMSSLRVAQAITALGVGIGSAWTAVTRLAATNYTNTTGKYIILAVSGSASAGSQRIQFTVGGVAVITSGPPGSSGVFLASSVMVPPGAVYRWDSLVGSLTSVSAWELR